MYASTGATSEGDPESVAPQRPKGKVPLIRWYQASYRQLFGEYHLSLPDPFLPDLEPVRAGQVYYT